MTIILALGDANADHMKATSTDFAAHLSRHGFCAVSESGECKPDEEAAFLLARAEQADADIIVIGGCVHSRVHSWLRERVTHRLMHETRIPLLLSH